MSANTSIPLPRHRARPVLFGLTLLIACLMLPRVTHPGFVPSGMPRAQRPADPQTRKLLDMVHHLAVAKTPTSGLAIDRHALRRAVTFHAVRLPVNRMATHPLAGPVAVHVAHLGAPGKRLRLVRLPRLQSPATSAGRTDEKATMPTPRVAVLEASPAQAAPVVKKMPLQTAAPLRPGQTGRARPGRSVLVAGDSLSIYLAGALKPLLTGRSGRHFTARGKVSSGLARPDFFDWEREMVRQSIAAKPDTVIIMIATNDNQTMTRPDGVKVAFGRRGWNAEYRRRVRRLVELARRGNPQARIYWVGAPVMAKPQLNADVAAINRIIAAQLATLPGCQFVDVWHTLADRQGHYVAALPTVRGSRPIRTKDGVHLKPYGARLLAEACLAAMGPTLASLP